jgi:hypothetical protein
MIAAICPFCLSVYKVSEQFIGKQLTCKTCQNPFVMKKSTDTLQYPTLYLVAVNNGLINKEQLKEAISAQKQANQAGKSDAPQDILIEKNIISTGLMRKLLIATNRLLDMEFGLIAVRDEYVVQEDVNKAIKIQAATFKKDNICRLIGDILIETSGMSKEQRKKVLIEQREH